MDRKPNTTNPLPCDSTTCAKPRMAGSPLWRSMFAEAKAALGVPETGASFGLVGVSGTRGWFQVWSDHTPYNVELSTQELAMFIQ